MGNSKVIVGQGEAGKVTPGGKRPHLMKLTPICSVQANFYPAFQLGTVAPPRHSLTLWLHQDDPSWERPKDFFKAEKQNCLMFKIVYKKDLDFPLTPPPQQLNNPDFLDTLLTKPQAFKDLSNFFFNPLFTFKPPSKMQFSTIIATVTLALAASASPVLEARTTPAQDAAQQCGNQQTLKCCNSVTQQLFNLIPINIGLGCTAIDVLNILPINQVCSTQVACCQSEEQTGLINVGNVCPIVL
ncbi:MAG: hypothetical protein M1825_003979 [Sarcosagium campestre]|nr:MAG: hypothetical protein M1825_003979 [Sarcosagium campestre]